MLFNSFQAAGAACLGDWQQAIGDGSSGVAGLECRGQSVEEGGALSAQFSGRFATVQGLEAGDAFIGDKAMRL